MSNPMQNYYKESRNKKENNFPTENESPPKSRLKTTDKTVLHYFKMS